MLNDYLSSMGGKKMQALSQLDSHLEPPQVFVRHYDHDVPKLYLETQIHASGSCEYRFS